MSVRAAELPELVQAGISSALASNKHLSWKIRENAKGTLIQLVWKSDSVGNSGLMGSKWNSSTPHSAALASSSNLNKSKCPRKKRNPPSRQRRNALRLARFLESKNRSQPDTQDDGEEATVLSNSSVCPAAAETGSIDASKSEHGLLECTPESSFWLLNLLIVLLLSTLEAQDNCAGLHVTTCDGVENWIPVGAYHAAGGGGVKEFSVLDVEGLEKKVSFTLHSGQPFLRTEFGPSSTVLSYSHRQTN